MKRKKVVVIGILAIFCVIIAVNFSKIKFGLNILGLYLQEKRIESIVDAHDNTNIVVDNPLESVLSSENNGDNGGITVNNEEKSITNTAEKTHTKKTYNSIVIEYNIQLELLQSSFEDELDTLIQKGIHEYSMEEVSNTKLANKYLSLGADLEGSCDKKFNKLIKEMEKELKSNGHSTSILNEIRHYYTSYKDAKKLDTISRGMKHM